MADVADSDSTPDEIEEEESIAEQVEIVAASEVDGMIKGVPVDTGNSISEVDIAPQAAHAVDGPPAHDDSRDGDDGADLPDYPAKQPEGITASTSLLTSARPTSGSSSSGYESDGIGALADALAENLLDAALEAAAAHALSRRQETHAVDGGGSGSGKARECNADGTHD